MENVQYAFDAIFSDAYVPSVISKYWLAEWIIRITVEL